MLVRIGTVLFQPKRHGRPRRSHKLRVLSAYEGRRSSAAVSAARCLRFASAGSRVPRLCFSSRLPTSFCKSPGDALAEPVDAGLGILPGARHCESHCVPPLCTPRAAASFLICLSSLENQPLRGSMADRAGLAPLQPYISQINSLRAAFIRFVYHSCGFGSRLFRPCRPPILRTGMRCRQTFSAGRSPPYGCFPDDALLEPVFSNWLETLGV